MQAVGEDDSNSDKDDELYPAEALRAIDQWSPGVATAQIYAPRFKLVPGQAVWHELKQHQPSSLARAHAIHC